MRRRGERKPSNLHRFLLFARPYRWLIALAAFLGGVNLIVPLAIPWAVKEIIDGVLNNRLHLSLETRQLHLAQYVGVVLAAAATAAVAGW